MTSAPTSERSDPTPTAHARPADEILSFLEVDPEVGLAAAGAAERHRIHGPNVVPEQPPEAWWRVLGRQFVSPLIAILGVAVVISAAVGEVTDAVVIGGIIIVNGILGFVQEWRAEQAIAALKAMLSPTTIVRREGHDTEIAVGDIVPGDIVVLVTGARVPADVRIVDVSGVMVDESALTGESGSVVKAPDAVAVDTALAERTSMAYGGTIITHGGGSGVVVATGAGTELGRIARLTQDIERVETPLQRELAGLGRTLGAAAVGIAALVSVIGVVGGNDIDEMLLTGLSLAVALVPEGLPAVVTVTLALGIRSMARQHALIRRLEAAETLGAATVICTDKTGTLTSNQMVVRRVWTPVGGAAVAGEGYAPEGSVTDEQGSALAPVTAAALAALGRTGRICNRASIERADDEWAPVGEPTEAALVTLAARLGVDTDIPRAVEEIPFDSVRKRMDVVVEEDGGLVRHTKGAPDVIVAGCSMVREAGGDVAMSDERREAILRQVDDLAAQGLRTLALACGPLDDLDGLVPDGGDGLSLLGIVGILDPPRPEVRRAVAQTRTAGVDVIVITGDAGPTALAIARDIGLPVDRTVTGVDLESMDDESLARELDGGAVFARTAPEHKLRIVRLLQERGEVVAMTGDGVNDAPALQRAQIGIAMGRRGTDVAKAASDVVLTDDHFASIVDAVAEGRRQYASIRRFVRYLLSSNLGEVVAITGNLLIGGPLILQPVQILWINLLTDGATAVTLGLESLEDDVMTRPPRRPGTSVIDRETLTWVLVLGVIIGGVALAVFEVARSQGADDVLAQSLAFTSIVVLEKVNVFNFRSDRLPLTHIGVFSNRWLVLAWLMTLTLHIAALYLPILQDALDTTGLELWHWLVLFAIAAPLVAGGETAKWFLRRRAGSGPNTLGATAGVGDR